MVVDPVAQGQDGGGERVSQVGQFVGACGGMEAMASRVTNPSRSIERSVCVSTFAVIPPMASRSCPNRSGPASRLATMSGVQRSVRWRSTVRAASGGHDVVVVGA